MTEFHRVVTGVSTQHGAGPARWAAQEATARHAELRIVTARPAADDLSYDVAETRLAAARRLLGFLSHEVTAGWPDLPVTTELATGPPATVLRAEAERADLLVVGADDASPFAQAISGSVPGDLLTTTPCPLAVVPRPGRTVPPSAPVVVALDETPTAQAALAYGYVAAARSARPLTVLRCVATGQLRVAAMTAQGRLLIAYGELYPTVAVSTDVVTDDPRHALVAVSRHAAVLVLGARGRLASGLFGSVSHDLVRRSGCPVVIARTPPAPMVLSS